jgi:hypothetical protein
MVHKYLYWHNAPRSLIIGGLFINIQYVNPAMCNEYLYIFKKDMYRNPY